MPPAPVETVAIGCEPTVLSDLTGGMTLHSGTASATSNLSSLSCEEVTMNVTKKCGQPKGLTKEAIESIKRRKLQALNYAATQFASIQEAAADIGLTRVGKGAYEMILKDAHEKFAIEENTISKVLSRLRPGRNKITAGRGHISPLIAIEAHFLDTILQLAAMGQPVTPSIAIEMINSMVASNKLQEQIVEWKKSIYQRQTKKRAVTRTFQQPTLFILEKNIGRTSSSITLR